MSSSFPTQGPPLSFTAQEECKPRSLCSPASTHHHHPDPLGTPRGLSAHLGGSQATSPCPAYTPNSAPQPCSHRGSNSSSAEPVVIHLGKMPEWASKAGLELERQPVNFYRENWGWGEKQEGGAPGGRCPGPMRGMAPRALRPELPHCKPLLKEPYLKVLNNLNASGKKSASLYLMWIPWEKNQTHKFSGSKSRKTWRLQQKNHPLTGEVAFWQTVTKITRRCLAGRSQELKWNKVCFFTKYWPSF